MAVLLPWLAAFFVALGLGATALAAVRRGTPRGSDVRVLRAIGFTRQDIRRCAVVEALIVAGVGVLIGVPVGLAAGHGVWRLATDDLGVNAEQAHPAPAVVAAILVASAAALVASWLGARRALVLADDLTKIEG